MTHARFSTAPAERVSRRGWMALVMASALAPLSCKDEQAKPISATRERSQAVEAAPGAAAPAPNPASTPATVQASKPRRALCADAVRDGKGLPKKPISQSRIASAKPLPEALKAEPGTFTWVNFWAAWCAPCKEEIPRLIGWERTAAQSGRRLRVAFVSLDDDERQLSQFLQSSPSLHATYWLKEGKERDEWLKAAGIDEDPELPVHLLVDSKGRVRCRVQGAVEDADYAELKALLAE